MWKKEMRRRFVKKEIATKYIKGKHRKRVKLFRRKGDDRLIYKIRKQIDSFRINYLLYQENSLQFFNPV